MNSQNKQLDQQPENAESQNMKEMRLWELRGKGDILGGWYEIVLGIIGPLLIIVMIIYLLWTKQFNHYFKGIGFTNGMLLVGLILLGSLYRIGKGIWKIFLGKSELLRKRWTWYFSVIILPFGMIAPLVSYLRLPEKDLGHTIGLFSIILAFGAIYYYLWTIKGKFSDKAVNPMKNKLQELSQWPVSKDRPLPFYLLSLILVVLSLPLILIDGFISIYSIFDPSRPTGLDLINIIVGLLTGITFLVSGIGLARMKKYGFVSIILSTLLLAVMTWLNMGTGLNFYLYVLVVFIFIDFYFIFEKEKLN